MKNLTATGTAGWPRVWLPHLLCLLMPLTALGFAVTGPHRWYEVLPWLLPQVGIVLSDLYGPRHESDPDRTLPAWPFDCLVYAQALLHFAAVGATVWMASQLDFSSWSRALDAGADLAATVWIVGTSSAICAMVGGHELIHRRSSAERTLGRAMLVTVLYEHFFTEHLRGHHARVATEQDPATARFGETFNAFFARTVPAQFLSAWRLEKARLGDPAMSNWDPRMLRHRCLHGVATEAVLLGAVLATCGPLGLLALALQAFTAVRELEAVNYMEHWGLKRRGRYVNELDSWDCDAASTHYVMVGLARHADHHAHATIPYHQLCLNPASARLPFGYQAMVLMIEFRPAHFVRVMTEELRRRGLGPFQAQAS